MQKNSPLSAGKIPVNMRGAPHVRDMARGSGGPRFQEKSLGEYHVNVGRNLIAATSLFYSISKNCFCR